MNWEIKKTTGRTHCFARCKDCGREFQNHMNAQALAAKHARRYGHTVVGDVGIAFRYEPLPKP